MTDLEKFKDMLKRANIGYETRDWNLPNAQPPIAATEVSFVDSSGGDSAFFFTKSSGDLLKITSW